MEHYRSLFATAAIMVLGLVATSPFLTEQNSTPSKTGLQSALSDGAATDDAEIWTDPPRHGRGQASVPEAPRLTNALAGVALPKPATFTLLSPDIVALLAADDRGRMDAPQRLQAVRRHRAAKVAGRIRPQSETDMPPVAGSSAPAEAVVTQPQKAARIDPIGDILRGLGIGRDS